MTGTVLLDASAVLALILDEPGVERVEARLEGAVLTTANLAEVLAKHVDRGVDPRPVTGWLEDLGVRIEPILAEDAARQAAVRARDRERGQRPPLSLADRLCLAVALRLDLPVLTADRTWVDRGVPVEVELLRARR